MKNFDPLIYLKSLAAITIFFFNIYEKSGGSPFDKNQVKFYVLFLIQLQKKML